MRLSKRIYAICDAVSQGESIADIGTDHGYVPMILVKKKVSPYVIMSDISADSLSKSVETFEACKIPTSKEQFRVSDGLDGIEFGEVDDIIIAGLGAYTIIDILDRDIDKSRSFKKLILQPRKYSGNLRYYLYTHGWDITKETLAAEGKFVCEIITAVPTEHTHRQAPYPADYIAWRYPDAFAYADYDLLKQRIAWKLSSIDEEISNLQKSRSDASSDVLVLQSEKEYLKGLLIKAAGIGAAAY